jgi:Protein of unknown function (DUF5672)
VRFTPRKLELKDVTLVLVSGVNIRKSFYALWRSSIAIDFGSILFITDKTLNSRIRRIKVASTDGFALDSLDAYSKYCVYHLGGKIDSKYALIVQADGYVLHPKSWTPQFFRYDYIGAPWKVSNTAYIDPFGNHQRIGNGGFSLRSKKLLDTPNSYNIVWEVNQGDFYKHMGVGSQAEDGIICVHNRHVYEAAGNVFAPLDVALAFGFENKVAEYVGKPTFGFHKHYPKLWDRVRDLAYRLIFLIRYPFQ